MLEELKELLADIRTYQELEEAGPNKAFWKALEIGCDKEIESAAPDSRSREAGVHSSVMDELTSSFQGKSSLELDAMGADIQAKLDSGDGSLDTEFWEGVLSQLQVYRARAELREFHEKMLQRWLEVIEKKRADLQRYREEHPEEVAAEAAAAAAAAATAVANHTDGAGADGGTFGSADSRARDEASKGLGDLEEELGLSDEVRLADQVYWWQDKYRPRKPRYFNRVKTGYDWNKYNQAHYDHDNPPPKTVQGYKFSIFYPDLMDRTVTPKYICEPSDTKEFMILRFSAGKQSTTCLAVGAVLLLHPYFAYMSFGNNRWTGAPYEDVAFKIVNREWEFGRKAGFRASFERGVMNLFFNFKRHRYRK